MPPNTDDIVYGYLQLGIEAGATLSEIRAVLARAEVYRYATKARLDHVRRYVAFFLAREKLGGFDQPFADLRKAYRRKAMAWHPDRNAGDKQSEEALKDINSAYALVEKINQQAKDFYKKSAAERQEITRLMREATAREAGDKQPEIKAKKPKQGRAYRSAFTSPDTAATGAGAGKKYLAASVPRSIRTARLSYLPLDVVIGHRRVKRDNDIDYIFDYFMLPEDQFLRAKSYLAAPEIINPALQYGKFNPPFVLKDIKEVVVPSGVEDADAFARDYFKRAFGIEGVGARARGKQ